MWRVIWLMRVPRGHFAGGVIGHGVHDGVEGYRGGGIAEDAAIDLGQQHWIVIGRAAEHDAVHVGQFGLGLRPAFRCRH